jgi:plasmid stabilization system protein ParE
MRPKLMVRRVAEAQLSEAHRWYEERAPGLGGEFLRAFDAACAQIERQPMAYPVVFLDYRRKLLRKFPFGVFYVRESGYLVVAAVFHLARSPLTIRKRLKP